MVQIFFSLNYQIIKKILIKLKRQTFFEKFFLWTHKIGDDKFQLCELVKINIYVYFYFGPSMRKKM